jgi:hypothetical protein
MKKIKVKTYKSAITGEFVSKRYAEKHKKTTVAMMVTKRIK